MTDLDRMQQIEDRFKHQRPPALAMAYTAETFRQLAADSGVCADCLAKLPDPLGEDFRLTGLRGQA